MNPSGLAQLALQEQLSHGRPRRPRCWLRAPIVRRVPSNRWCQNYGYIGTDGEVHWREEGGALVGVAWRDATERQSKQLGH
eukprot:g15146.t1